MAVQWLCFHTSGGRPRNIEPGLNSAPSFLPNKPRAALGEGYRIAGVVVRKGWEHGATMYLPRLSSVLPPPS